MKEINTEMRGMVLSKIMSWEKNEIMANWDGMRWWRIERDEMIENWDEMSVRVRSNESEWGELRWDDMIENWDEMSLRVRRDESEMIERWEWDECEMKEKKNEMKRRMMRKKYELRTIWASHLMIISSCSHLILLTANAKIKRWKMREEQHERRASWEHNHDEMRSRWDESMIKMRARYENISALHFAVTSRWSVKTSWCYLHHVHIVSTCLCDFVLRWTPRNPATFLQDCLTGTVQSAT